MICMDAKKLQESERKGRKAKKKKKRLRTRKYDNHLAKSMSESGTGDSGSDDDNVGITVSGSAFSSGDRGDPLHALASRLRRNSAAVLLVHQNVKRHKPHQHGGKTPPKRVRIHHSPKFESWHGTAPRVLLHERSLSLALCIGFQ